MQNFMKILQRGRQKGDFKEDSYTLEQGSKGGIVTQRDFLNVTDLSISFRTGYLSLLRESKFLGLTFFEV